MAYSVLAPHVAAHSCDYYIVKYQCKSLEQLQNLDTQYAIEIQRLGAQGEEALASGAERWTSKERARKVTIKFQSGSSRCHWFSSTELAVYLRTGGTCWMSHNEVPVFVSKIIYMMHACRRLLEDRSPGLLEAATVKLDVVEFQARPKAGAPPPSVSNSTVTHPVDQKWSAKTCSSTDTAMGDKLEAGVAAEPAKDESDFSSCAAEDQATKLLVQATGSSNNEELHGQQDRNDKSPSHRDAKPPAQAANLETGTTDSTNDNDYIPSNSLTSTDEETEHSGGEGETYQPV